MMFGGLIVGIRLQLFDLFDVSFSLSRIAAMSAMPRGGATTLTGSTLACAAGSTSIGTSTATLARPFAAFGAAMTLARTFVDRGGGYRGRTSGPRPCGDSADTGLESVKKTHQVAWVGVGPSAPIFSNNQ
jgi:hypothetical protein